MIHQRRKGEVGSLPEGLYLLKQEETMWPASANVLLIPDGDGVTLVDVGCGREEVYLRLKEFLCSRGFRIEDVHTVVLTHAHLDHMGGYALSAGGPQPMSPRGDRAHALPPHQAGGEDRQGVGCGTPFLSRAGWQRVQGPPNFLLSRTRSSNATWTNYRRKAGSDWAARRRAGR